MQSKLAASIRRKKLGVLIKDARLFIGKTKKECGQMIGISGGAFNSIENGKRSISLPELEVLANNFSLPIKYFFQDELQTEKDQSDLLFNPDDINSSNVRIGEVISKAFSESNMTYKELLEKTGISGSRMKKFERGDSAVPIPELEILCNLFNIWIYDLIDDSTGSGKKAIENQAVEAFRNLEPALQDFISKPVNTPYLEVAKKLSSLSTEQLRSIAEGLLEITI
jgi:transcriptional regulator with XRE-family HTH domain